MAAHQEAQTGAHPDPNAPLSSQTKLTIAILVLGATIMLLNETSLSVALPAIMEDFSIPATSAQWLVTGFMLTMAVVIPTTGFLLQRLSTRQMFFAGTALFLVGTFVAATAPVFALLFLARVIQAAGTALMMPLLMTVTMTLVPPMRRGAVMGIISIVIAVAPAMGPTLGGFILKYFSWHYNFWLIAPLLILLMIFGFVKLPNIGESRTIPLDIASVILSALAFGGLVYGLSSINEILSGHGTVALIAAAVGAVALVIFVSRQRTLQADNRALMDLRPFGVRNYTLSVLLMVLCFGMMLGVVTVLPIYLQTSLAATAAIAGLTVMPGGLLQGLLSPFIGRIFDRVGPRPLLVPGAILLAAAMWMLSTVNENSSIAVIVGMHITMAVGIALMMTPLMTTALGSLPGQLYGHGSAIMNTLQQLAGATGTAILVVFLTRGTESAMAQGASVEAATAHGAHLAFICAGVLALVCVALSFVIKRVEVHGHAPAAH